MVLQKNEPFYSDMIVRINSKEERKVRVLVVTDSHLFILIQEKHNHQFTIKSESKLSHIQRVEVAMNNALLVNIFFKNK